MRRKRAAGVVRAGLLLALLVTWCGGSGAPDAASSQAAQAEQDETIAGGWQQSDVVNDILTADERALFEKANADGGRAPAAVLATQVVSGTNYAYLCRDETGWDVEVIYEDLADGAEVTSREPFDVTAYVGG